jgi:hypothetical protein
MNWTVVAADLSGDIQFEDTDAARQGLGSGFYRGVSPLFAFRDGDLGFNESQIPIPKA